MDIEYLPNKGFILNSVKIEWNDERNTVREKIGNRHKEDDKTIDVAQFFEGDESMNIHQKRDVYENLNSKNDILFLNYNKDNKLKELEVHSGFDILIDNIRLGFGNEISDFINQFQKNGIEYSETEKGNYLLKKLKILIADSESMGGNGTRLSYFYATSDISHLAE
ncbi:hypothetical protein Q4Q34_01390 [Flavivirga abyssicola]|uniref:hypothetical protein n=1 Tax=Flavivirga abyssicola TaxID=3063533 RepID=UPI0026E03CF6|nr:hypothetical protein [Flavivirga sp. MEBiC07777]WVK13692.1 hypothetical protein Q4Q34_01390 [Flavivirga sp. MEBiC07777]